MNTNTSNKIMMEAIQMYDNLTDSKRGDLADSVLNNPLFLRAHTDIRNQLFKSLNYPRTYSKNSPFDGYKPLDYVVWLVAYNALAGELDEEMVKKQVSNIYPVVHDTLIGMGQKFNPSLGVSFVQIKPFEGSELAQNPTYKLAAALAGWEPKKGGKRSPLRKRKRSQTRKNRRSSTRRH